MEVIFCRAKEGSVPKQTKSFMEKWLLGGQTI